MPAHKNPACLAGGTDMTRQALLDLAARCESATGVDRELDEAIERAVGTYSAFSHYRLGDDDIPDYVPTPYTASLDAAMTLVPKGDLHLEIKCGKIWAFVGTPIRAATAVTPALALTAACLRALAQEIEHDGHS